MKHASFQEFLLHLEKITFLKVAFLAHLGTGMKWRTEDWLYLPRKKTSAGTICHRDTVHTDCQPSPGPCPLSLPPSGSPSSCTELTQRFFFFNKKEVCISTGFACSAIFCDQRIETAACLSSLAIKPAVDRLCPNPTATGKVQPQI